MKVLKTLWGLLVDDGRLASILVIGLIVAAVLSLGLHVPAIGSVVIWLALIISLVVSVNHQLKLKLNKG